MNPMTRALTTLVVINMQVAGLIIAAFWGRDYLSLNYPLGFSWDIIIVPLLLIAIGHSYYIMIRYLLRLNDQSGSDKRGK